MIKRKNRPHGPGGAARNGRDKSSKSNLYYNSNGKTIPVFVGNKFIGEVVGNTFLKHIKGSLHILWRPPAIALDIESLRFAEESGAEFVEIIDTETGDLFFSSINQIWQKGTKFNRGYGNQIFLRLEYWNQPGKQDSCQLSLFEAKK